MATHKGSWFGLPDYGVTELFTRNRTDEGGSDIFPNKSGEVLGETDENRQSSVGDENNNLYSFLGSQVLPKPTTGIELNARGEQDQYSTQPIPDMGRPPLPEGVSEEELNEIYNPAFERLNQYEQMIRGQLPGLIGDINAQANLGEQKLRYGKEGAGRQLTESERTAGQRKESATAAARRLFNELQQGLAQRFGGASSAGLAAGQLQGREFQRQRGDIEQGYGNTMREIENQRKQVENDYQVATMDLNNRKQELINQANREFQERLAQINTQRGGLESEKAAQRLNELQKLRDAIYQINFDEFQTRRQLELARQQQQQQLASAQQSFNDSAQRGFGATNQYMEATTTNPYSENTISQTPSLLDKNALVGQIIRRRDDEEDGPYLNFTQGGPVQSAKPLTSGFNNSINLRGNPLSAYNI